LPSKNNFCDCRLSISSSTQRIFGAAISKIYFIFLRASVILLRACCVTHFNVQSTYQQSNQCREFKFSLLNPAIVVLMAAFRRALTKTQQHGVCPKNYQ